MYIYLTACTFSCRVLVSCIQLHPFLWWLHPKMEAGSNSGRLHETIRVQHFTIKVLGTHVTQIATPNSPLIFDYLMHLTPLHQLTIQVSITVMHIIIPKVKRSKFRGDPLGSWADVQDIWDDHFGNIAPVNTYNWWTKNRTGVLGFALEKYKWDDHMNKETDIAAKSCGLVLMTTKINLATRNK